MPGSERSEPNIAGVSRVGESGGNTAVAFDPCPRRRRDPAGDLRNPFMVFNETWRGHRFLVSNPVPQRPQRVQRPVDLPAGQGHARRERVARRAPERHFAVGPACRCQTAPRARQRDPEPERQRCHDPVRFVPMPGSRQFRPGSRNPRQGAPVKSCTGVVMPGRAALFAESAVRGVAQRDLQSLQRSVECGADRSVPDMEAARRFPVAPGAIEMRDKALARECNLEIVKDPVRVAEIVTSVPGFAIFIAYTPDPPLPPGMRPGFLFAFPTRS